MSFCRLAWKEKVFDVFEALTELCVRRRVEGVNAWMVYGLAAPSGVSYKVLMPLLGCKGVFSLQWRRLVDGAWTGSYKHGCVSTNKWELGFLLTTKIMEETLLNCSPCLLCWAYGSTRGWKDCKGMKYRKETYSDIFKLNKNKLEKIQLSVETKTKTSVRRGRSCNQQILRWPGYLKCVGESLCWTCGNTLVWIDCK